MARPKNKTVKEITKKLATWLMKRNNDHFSTDDMTLCNEIVTDLRKAKELK